MLWVCVHRLISADAFECGKSGYFSARADDPDGMAIHEHDCLRRGALQCFCMAEEIDGRRTPVNPRDLLPLQCLLDLCSVRSHCVPTCAPMDPHHTRCGGGNVTSRVVNSNDQTKSKQNGPRL